MIKAPCVIQTVLLMIILKIGKEIFNCFQAFHVAFLSNSFFKKVKISYLYSEVIAVGRFQKVQVVLLLSLGFNCAYLFLIYR